MSPVRSPHQGRGLCPQASCDFRVLSSVDTVSPSHNTPRQGAQSIACPHPQGSAGHTGRAQGWGNEVLPLPCFCLPLLGAPLNAAVALRDRGALASAETSAEKRICGTCFALVALVLPLGETSPSTGRRHPASESPAARVRPEPSWPLGPCGAQSARQPDDNLLMPTQDGFCPSEGALLAALSLHRTSPAPQPRPAALP